MVKDVPSIPEVQKGNIQVHLQISEEHVKMKVSGCIWSDSMFIVCFHIKTPEKGIPKRIPYYNIADKKHCT